MKHLSFKLPAALLASALTMGIVGLSFAQGPTAPDPEVEAFLQKIPNLEETPHGRKILGTAMKAETFAVLAVTQKQQGRTQAADASCAAAQRNLHNAYGELDTALLRQPLQSIVRPHTDTEQTTLAVVNYQQTMLFDYFIGASATLIEKACGTPPDEAVPEAIASRVAKADQAAASGDMETAKELCNTMIDEAMGEAVSLQERRFKRFNPLFREAMKRLGLWSRKGAGQESAKWWIPIENNLRSPDSVSRLVMQATNQATNNAAQP